MFQIILQVFTNFAFAHLCALHVIRSVTFFSQESKITSWKAGTDHHLLYCTFSSVLPKCSLCILQAFGWKIIIYHNKPCCRGNKQWLHIIKHVRFKSTYNANSIPFLRIYSCTIYNRSIRWLIRRMSHHSFALGIFSSNFRCWHGQSQKRGSILSQSVSNSSQISKFPIQL